MTKKIDSINFKDFLLQAVDRFPEGSLDILKVLKDVPALNMDRISINAKINRSNIKTCIAPLETLDLVGLNRYGQAKEYYITDLGLEFLDLLNG